LGNIVSRIISIGGLYQHLLHKTCNRPEGWREQLVLVIQNC
jgi:hypothetical protein